MVGFANLIVKYTYIVGASGSIEMV